MRARALSYVDHIGRASLRFLPLLILSWLPTGHTEGRAWVYHDRTRSVARHLKIDLRTGHWLDLATGKEGTNAVALAAYIYDVTSAEAAIQIAQMLGLHEQQKVPA